MGQPLVVDDWPSAPILTERLVLRAAEARDRQAFLDLATDADAYRFLGGPRDRAALEDEPVPVDSPGQFVVEHEGLFTGWVGLSRREAERPGRIADGPPLELSYVLLPTTWGHGYAGEASAAVLSWARARFDEPVVLCTQTANTLSMALAERLGFVEVERFEEFGAEQWFGVRL